MANKGYSINELNHQDKLLNEYCNEYGIDFKSQRIKTFSLSVKPRNIVNTSIIDGKR